MKGWAIWYEMGKMCVMVEMYEWGGCWMVSIFRISQSQINMLSPNRYGKQGIMVGSLEHNSFTSHILYSSCLVKMCGNEEDTSDSLWDGGGKS